MSLIIFFINYSQKGQSLNFKIMKLNIIYCRRYYTSVHTTTYYKKRIRAQDLRLIPFTEKIKNKIVAIPLHSKMSNKKTTYFFKNINKFFKI